MYLFYNYFTFLKVYLNLYCPLISLFLLVFYFCNILGFFKRENKQRWITVSKQTHSRNHGFFFPPKIILVFFLGKQTFSFFLRKMVCLYSYFLMRTTWALLFYWSYTRDLYAVFSIKWIRLWLLAKKKKEREKQESIVVVKKIYIWTLGIMEANVCFSDRLPRHPLIYIDSQYFQMVHGIFHNVVVFPVE